MIAVAALVALLIVRPGDGPEGGSGSIRERAAAPVGPYRTLVMDETFDRLDRSVWTDQRGKPPHTYGSPYNPDKENTFFDPAQVSVTDGILHLRTDRRRATDPLGGASYDYVSGVVHSGTAFSFTYGYVESRVYIPEDTGYWPSVWMLPAPVDSRWPPEVDIAEFGDVKSRRPTFNVHWKGPDGGHRQMGSTAYGEEAAYRGSWHTYGLLWEPGRMQVYVDGEKGPEFTGEDVPDQPMYLVFGQGVVRGKDPEPDAMKVDHVRVWSDSASRNFVGEQAPQ